MFSKIWKKLRRKPLAFVDMNERERYLKAKEVFLQIIDMGPFVDGKEEVLREARKGLSEAARMDAVTRNKYAENLRSARDLVELEIKTRVLLFARDAVGYTFDKELLEAVFALLYSDVFCDSPFYCNSRGEDIRKQRKDWLHILTIASVELETLDPKQSRIVNKIFPQGMTNDETAKALGIPLARVEGEWRAAKAWLRLQLG